MFTTRGNQRGAIPGLITGIVISLIIGFGQPKPPAKMLNFSTDGCSTFNHTTTTISNTIFGNMSQSLAPIAAELTDPEDESSYFYFYRISYMWYVVIGFFITLFVGYVLSFIFEKLNRAGEIKIYTDSSQMFYNTDLFSPPFAKRLKKQMAKKLESNGFTGITSEHNGDFKKDTLF